MENDKTDEPMFERNGMKIPEALRGLIEKLPLLEGENPDHFLSLLKAVVEDQKPKGIMDWINAVDTAIKYWEELRLRRSSAALIQCNMFDAVNYFLNEMRPVNRDLLAPEIYSIPDYNSKLALGYFSEKPSEKKKTRATLAQRGIALPELQAKAMQLSSASLQIFERMSATREDSRRKLRKEAARGKRDRNNGEFNGSRSDGNREANRGKPRQRKA